eukprot:TRINITY_DN15226_c0_g1_i1.p1 TRINITY_DN15226_c0_g1~~TRINITY_DN15226_c0_g1_i1.p1  ORF type:complete len:464 (+),score=53.78 TRINITY_DN15226_c0_g1_i1:73-1392(+)
MNGFTDISIIDRDTIEKSNLSRQFLFFEKDIDKKKSVVAKENIRKLFPRSQSKVKNYENDINEWYLDDFEKYDIIISAVDNRETRFFLNYMVIALGKIMIDCGTKNWIGNVDIISPSDEIECFQCKIEQNPKDYLSQQKNKISCTILNHPSSFDHCIQWAQQEINSLKDYENIENLGEHLFNYLLSKAKSLNTSSIHFFEYDSIIKKEKILPIQKKDQMNKIFVTQEIFLILNESSLEWKRNPKDESIKNYLIFSLSCLKAILFNLKITCFFEFMDILKDVQPTIAIPNSVIGSMVVLQLININSPSLSEKVLGCNLNSIFHPNFFMLDNLKSSKMDCICTFKKFKSCCNFQKISSNQLFKFVSKFFEKRANLVLHWNGDYLYNIYGPNEDKEKSLDHLLLKFDVSFKSNFIVFFLEDSTDLIYLKNCESDSFEIKQII